MGTRSVVARQQGDGFKGRYIHWDGYPEHVGAQLFRIVTEVHGGDVEAALSVLVDEHYGWSTLGIEDSSTLGDRANVVDGHGVAYSRDEQHDEWITHDGDDWGTEWAYVLNDRGMSIFRRQHSDGTGAIGWFGNNTGGTVWSPYGFVSWGAETEPDWEHLSTKGASCTTS